MAELPLDVITIGRCSVDLYGQQIGGRLEDVTSFAKSVGGCPANIAIGTARLGLKSAFLSRVGDEQMGRFIHEQMQREGVDVSALKTDHERLTALVILAVRDDKTFPLIFYRENCADMALCEEDVDAAFIASAKAIIVTGTHFSQKMPEAAQRKAMRLAKQAGGKVVLDIDYRPNLWGLAGHAAGEARYVRADHVTRHLQSILPDCDVIVGTEEEFAIAGGSEDALKALKAVRSLATALLVLKRGPMGCVVFEGAIPDSLDKGIKGPGFPVEVYNVLGAGDAFMSGFLRGFLRNEPLETCCAYANACGAFAVSRLLCSPEIPTFEELQYFLTNGSPHHALRQDDAINHIHWATTRRKQADGLMAFAIDHRAQLRDIADRAGADHSRIGAFKALAVAATEQVAQGRAGYGMLIDGSLGREALFQAASLPHLWIGRPVEMPGSRPLRFEECHDIGSHLTEWPVWQTAKALCFMHPDDDKALMDDQLRTLSTYYEACRKVGRECLVEIITGKHGAVDTHTVSSLISRLYDRGIKPDWWKLEPDSNRESWANIEAVIRARDPYCRGVVLLGLEAPAAELQRAFAATKDASIVKGFAVGRTLFAHAAEEWLAGRMSDAEAIADMAGRFKTLCQSWLETRGRPQ